MEKYTLLIDNPDEELKSLIEKIKPECEESYIIHSSGGIEIITLVVSIINLVIYFAQYPILVQYLVDMRITVKFGGYTLHGTPNYIIKKVIESPELLKEIKKAYQKKNIKQDGDAGKILKFERRLEKLMEEYK